MKFRKIISAVCAFAVLASVSAFSLTVQAETVVPELKLEQTTYDSSTRKGTARLYVTGLDKAVPTDLSDVTLFEMNTLNVDVSFDEEKFDISLYSNEGRTPALASNFVKDSAFSGANVIPNSNDASNITMNMGLANGSGVYQTSVDSWKDVTLATINFQLLEGVTSADIDLNVTSVKVGVCKSSTELTTHISDTYFGLYNVGTKPAEITENMTYDFDTLGEAAPDFEKVVDVKTGDNDTDDKAVGFTKTFENAELAGATLKWYGTATLAAGGTKNFTKDIVVPNIEADNLIMGLIVQFDGNTYSDFDITKVEAVQ